MGSKSVKGEHPISKSLLRQPIYQGYFPESESFNTTVETVEKVSYSEICLKAAYACIKKCDKQARSISLMTPFGSLVIASGTLGASFHPS